MVCWSTDAIGVRYAEQAGGTVWPILFWKCLVAGPHMIALPTPCTFPSAQPLLIPCTVCGTGTSPTAQFPSCAAQHWPTHGGTTHAVHIPLGCTGLVFMEVPGQWHSLLVPNRRHAHFPSLAALAAQVMMLLLYAWKPTHPFVPRGAAHGCPCPHRAPAPRCTADPVLRVCGHRWPRPCPCRTLAAQVPRAIRPYVPLAWAASAAINIGFVGAWLETVAAAAHLFIDLNPVWEPRCSLANSLSITTYGFICWLMLAAPTDMNE